LELLCLFCSACSNHQLAKKPSGGEGMEEDLRLRRQWDLERLADPRTGEIPASIREKELAFAATLPAAEDNDDAAGRQLYLEFPRAFERWGLHAGPGY
jgi:hypothetical protein